MCVGMCLCLCVWWPGSVGQRTSLLPPCTQVRLAWQALLPAEPPHRPKASNTSVIKYCSLTSNVLAAIPCYLYNLRFVPEINNWLFSICFVFFEPLINFFQMFFFLSIKTSKQAFPTTEAHPFPFSSSGPHPPCSGLGEGKELFSRPSCCPGLLAFVMGFILHLGSGVSWVICFAGFYPYFCRTISFGSFLRKGTEGSFSPSLKLPPPRSSPWQQSGYMWHSCWKTIPFSASNLFS